MIKFYEINRKLEIELSANPWPLKISQDFQSFYDKNKIYQEDFKEPTMFSYKTYTTN